MSSPASYKDGYLHCAVWLADDSVVEVRVDRYLQDGKTSNSPAARKAYDNLMFHLARKTKTRAWASQYNLDGWIVNTKPLQRAFYGKGSPGDIQEVYFAASYCGLVDRSNAQQYADKHLGVDCSGFTGNYFGIDPNTNISQYDGQSKRRTRIEDVASRDVVVFMDGSGGYPHIALIESIRPSGGRYDLVLVHSRGAELGGVQSTPMTVTLQTSAKGHVYYKPSDSRTGYIVRPVGDGPPRP